MAKDTHVTKDGRVAKKGLWYNIIKRKKRKRKCEGRVLKALLLKQLLNEVKKQVRRQANDSKHASQNTSTSTSTN